MLVADGARALYLGPAYGLSAHRSAVAVLALGLHAPIGVARDPRDPARGFVEARSALIEPNRLHLLRTTADDLAFLYLDATARDLATVRRRCRRREAGAGLDVDGERALVAALRPLPRDATGGRTALAAIGEVLGLAPGEVDPRVAPVVRALLADPADAADAGAWAARIGLSASRFQRRFTAAAGVPFRRFRTWARMRAALAAAAGGATLTDAAHLAGFASSAHLGTAFREMFGMTPSRLLAGAPVVVDLGREG